MTTKIIKISTEHSAHENQRTQKINIEMMGGSPYFNYLWIDDVCYTIRKKARSIEIVKTK